MATCAGPRVTTLLNGSHPMTPHTLGIKVAQPSDLWRLRTVFKSARARQEPQRFQSVPGGLASSQAWKPVSEARLMASSTSPVREPHVITT